MYLFTLPILYPPYTEKIYIYIIYKSDFDNGLCFDLQQI